MSVIGDDFVRPMRDVEAVLCVPKNSWFVLNTEEAAEGNPGPSTAAGLIRLKWKWIRGFVYNIGYSSLVVASFWGLRAGLCLAWLSGMRPLVVNMDSQPLCSMFNSTTPPRIPLWLSPLYRQIYMLLNGS